MAKKEVRFIQTYAQGLANSMEIWVDKVTGVNYLFCSDGHSGGLTPLLNRDGTPVVTPVSKQYDE